MSERIGNFIAEKSEDIAKILYFIVEPDESTKHLFKAFAQQDDEPAVVQAVFSGFVDSIAPILIYALISWQSEMVTAVPIINIIVSQIAKLDMLFAASAMYHSIIATVAVCLFAYTKLKELKQ